MISVVGVVGVAIVGAWDGRMWFSLYYLWEVGYEAG